MNYSGSMKDMMKGVIDADRRMKELLPNAPLFPRVGSFYYTNPSDVPNPGTLSLSPFISSGQQVECLLRAGRCARNDESGEGSPRLQRLLRRHDPQIEDHVCVLRPSQQHVLHDGTLEGVRPVVSL